MQRCVVKLLLLVAVRALQIGAALVCPVDWTLLGQKCYRVYDAQEYTQPEGDAECVQAGARLAVVDTEEKIELLQDFLNAQYPDGQLLIGLINPTGAGPPFPYEWVNGCPLGDLIGWQTDDGEPDGKACAIYKDKFGTGHRWRGKNCDSLVCCAICEKPGNVIVEDIFVASGSSRSAVPVPGKLRIEQQLSGRKTKCLAACGLDGSCESFAYNSASRQCRLLSHNCDGNQHQDEGTWKTYGMRDI